MNNVLLTMKPTWTYINNRARTVTFFTAGVDFNSGQWGAACTPIAGTFITPIGQLVQIIVLISTET